MPGGVRALGQLGVDVVALDSFPFRGIRFIGDGTSSEAQFPRDHGSGVRRTTLHRALAARAAELGVAILWGARVRGGASQPVSVNGRLARYDWLVGADGLRGQVRRWAGLEHGRGSFRRFGFRQHFRVRPWSDFVEVHWAERCQLFVTPVGEQEVCVALLSRYSHPRLAEVLPSFPDVARRLSQARATSTEKGALCTNRTFHRVVRDRLALVGDASGSVDAITGDGISIAFQQAMALAEAMEAGDLALYQTAHRRIIRTPHLMGRLLVMMDRHAFVRRRALCGLAAEPGALTRLLDAHLGERAAPFGALQAATLAWQLLIL